MEETIPEGLKRFFPGGTTKKILNQTKKPIFMVSMKKGKIDITSYIGTEKGCNGTD
jgi:hypothetical protein